METGQLTLTNVQNLTTVKIFLATLLAIVVTVAYGVSVGNAGAGFNEGGIGTITSVFILALTSVVSFKIHRVRRMEANEGSAGAHVVWIVIGAGFAFLAFDEAFMIHENLDRLIHKIGGITQTEITDRIDDFLILLYGIIGVVFLFKYKSEIVRIPGLVTYLQIGFALMVLQVGADTIANGDRFKAWMRDGLNIPDMFKPWKLLEDSLKLLAAATLLAGMTHALRHVNAVKT